MLEILYLDFLPVYVQRTGRRDWQFYIFFLKKYFVLRLKECGNTPSFIQNQCKRPHESILYCSCLLMNLFFYVEIAPIYSFILIIFLLCLINSTHSKFPAPTRFSTPTLSHFQTF